MGLSGSPIKFGLLAWCACLVPFYSANEEEEEGGGGRGFLLPCTCIADE